MFTRTAESENRVILNAVALLTATLVFAMGRFRFLEYLGIERQVQAMILIPLVLVGFWVVVNSSRVCLHPLFLLPLVFLLGEVILRRQILAMADLGVATLMVGMILALGDEFSDRVLRFVIIISGIFSLLGILQFFVLFIEPSLTEYVVVPIRSNAHYGSESLIRHPVTLMGLGTGENYHLFGREITRLSSFASQPSAMLVVFMVPACLALTYGNGLALWGWITLLFCFLSLSGTVFLSAVFGVISIPILILRRRFYYAVFPFAIGLLMILWLIHYNTDLIVSIATYFGSIADFLGKSTSASFRFAHIIRAFNDILLSPLGLKHLPVFPAGLLLRSMAQASVFGLAVSTIAMITLFIPIGEVFNTRGPWFKERLTLILLYGQFITILVFNESNFPTTAGFVMLSLTFIRIKGLRHITVERELSVT